MKAAFVLGRSLTRRQKARLGFAQGAHAVPAQLQVEVESAADDVEMIVDQPRQDATTLEVDDLGLRTCQRHHLFVGANREKATVSDRHGGRGRLRARKRREQAAMQDR
jgi:hypothetical protein